MDITVQIIPQFVHWVSMLGIVVFALSGGVYAAEKEMDILGFLLIATVTAIGGGTLRDLLLSVPVFWVQQPVYIYICFGAALVAYFAASQVRLRRRWMLWLDAAGLASFAVIGTQISLTHGAPPIIAIVTGVMSATFGGVIRDVLCTETLTITQPEMYITCAVLGSTLFIALHSLNIDTSISVGLSFLAGFGLRMAAIIYHLELPKYSSKQ
ncbi:MAG: trimeric intracellular cation channel family protein [Arenicella sp.]